jgi:S-adenosylmethionine:tRNA-ribosyltransferase-isomerase (queuine synthetase)
MKNFLIGFILIAGLGYFIATGATGHDPRKDYVEHPQRNDYAQIYNTFYDEENLVASAPTSTPKKGGKK